MNTVFSSIDLLNFATRILLKAGLSKAKAFATAETLLEADLLGHRTHGLALLEAYANEVKNGGMTRHGQPHIINKKRAVEVWDGQYLPGIWLVRKAIDRAIRKVRTQGISTIIIQKSHHIGCLAAFMEAVTRQNLMMILSCSDPRNKTVAPYGSTTGVYSPNPLAVGIPTSGQPIIMDVSMSTTANAVIAQKKQRGEKLPHAWLLDAEGQPTNDPETFFKTPASTILPLGGMDVGYKGFGLGIMVEALTNALGGFGRAQHPTNWGASVFLQIIDPSVYGSAQPFLSEMDFLKVACLHSEPIDVNNPVRMPGQKGLALKAAQLQNGVALSENIVESLERLGKEHKSVLHLFR